MAQMAVVAPLAGRREWAQLDCGKWYGQAGGEAGSAAEECCYCKTTGPAGRSMGTLGGCALRRVRAEAQVAQKVTPCQAE